MNTDHWVYVRDFLSNPRNRAGAYKVRVIRAQVGPGQQVWRVRGVWHLLPAENQGKHHVYLEVVDGNGQRVNLARIAFENEAGPRGYADLDKGDKEPGTNTQMHSHETLKLRFIGRWNGWKLEDEYPSDIVEGLHTRWADEAPGNTWGHHSYLVVYELSEGPEPDLPIEDGTTDDPGSEEPGEPDTPDDTPPDDRPGDAPTEPIITFTREEMTAIRKALRILLAKFGG